MPGIALGRSVEELELVPGFAKSECVVVDRAGAVYGGGKDGVIRKLAPDGTRSEVARLRPFRGADAGPFEGSEAQSKLAGLAFDREGCLYVCDTGLLAVVRVAPNGEASIFADRVADRLFFVPNYPVFDRAGNLYVSNTCGVPLEPLHRFFPHFEAEMTGKANPTGWVGVFRPDGTSEVIAEVPLANGLAIDPQETAVYALMSGVGKCARIPIRPNGGYGEVEIFCDDLTGGPDGMAFTASGDLIVTIPRANRLVVVDPNGTASILIEDPSGAYINHPTNVAFGGPDFTELYVANTEMDHFARLPLEVNGHPLYDRT